jgi:hypothetical protein
MSDAVIPSYRVQREAAALPWRMLAVAGALLAVVAVGGAGWWAWKSYGGLRSVPLVEAPAGPFKVRPDDPGGLRVPNQNELIMERPGARNRASGQGAPQGAMTPGAEAPDLGGLRAAVQPPARPAPAPPPVAAPAPAPALAPPIPQAAAPVAEPAAQPVAAAPRLAAPVPSGRVQVQLGALVSDEAARAEWDRLARRAPELFQGRSPTIARLDRGTDQAPLFRLRTGGIADPEQAAQFCEQVRSRGGACVVVR